MTEKEFLKEFKTKFDIKYMELINSFPSEKKLIDISNYTQKLTKQWEETCFEICKENKLDVNSPIHYSGLGFEAEIRLGLFLKFLTQEAFLEYSKGLIKEYQKLTQ